jgi:hypothetical protein
MRSHILLLNVKHEWRPPAELERGRPRGVVLTRGGKILVVIAVLLVAGGLAAGIGLGLSVSRDRRDALLLAQQGETADAVVTRAWRSRDKEHEPRISYRFDIDGSAYSRETKVPLRFWSGLKPGSHIAVRYASSRPDLNHPADLEFSRTPAALPWVVFFAIAVWGPVALLPIRQQRRLLAEGRAALAIVTRHSGMKHGQHGQKLGMKYDYDFRLLSGAAASGSAGPVKEPPAVGARIAVLYDPDKPRRNAPYPFPNNSLARISHRW